MRITKTAIRRAMEDDTVLTYQNTNEASNFLRRVREIIFPFVQGKAGHEFFSAIPGKKISKKEMVKIIQANL